MVTHPSPEIPQELVDKIYNRRGSLHIYDEIVPEKTVFVVVDLDAGSCAREYEATEQVVQNVNLLAHTLRALGGVVAFVTSKVTQYDNLEAKLGKQRAEMYMTETLPDGKGTVLDDRLKVNEDDIRTVKQGASAFFPGKCDLHNQLTNHGVEYLLIAGLVTNICCESSARDACELGYKTIMISDALWGHGHGLHEASLSTFFRVFGDVQPTKSILGLLKC